MKLLRVLVTAVIMYRFIEMELLNVFKVTIIFMCSGYIFMTKNSKYYQMNITQREAALDYIAIMNSGEISFRQLLE